MSEQPSLEKRIETHLKQALEADSSETKHFHIRSALQFEECIETVEQVKQAQSS